MSLVVRRFAELLHDLQQLERTAARGDAILDAFTRHTPFEGGAVYLRDRDANLRLAAKSTQFVAPEIFADDPPRELVATADRVLVPLGSGRDHLGLLALTGGKYSEEDLDLLRAAAAYVGTLVANQRLSQEMREGDFQLKYRLWELESLYDIGLSIAGTLNIDELADEVLFRMISLINARRAALFLRDGDRFKPYRSFGDVPVTEADLQRLVATREAITLEGGTAVAVPVNGNNQIIGVLAAADRETRDGIGAFEANELRLLSLFANQVGIALENARLHRDALEKQAMERELELAATIQRDILPKSIPTIEGVEIAALSRPARRVGGDYHAFFECENGVTMLVADVSGKSMPAALLVSALHAAVQLLVREGRKLGEVATELNRHIHHWSAENKFITFIIASIDREAETLEYVNAGHNPGYVIIGDQLETLKSHGLPIGMLAQSKYMAQTRSFPAGSTVVLYSDGITEATGPDDEEYGSARLAAYVQRPDACPETLLEDVRKFANGAGLRDDATVIMLRR